MPSPKTSLVRSARVLLALITLAGFTCCASNDELEARMDRRNEKYSAVQDRREIRQEAREQRSDDWYERVMR